MTIIKFMGGLGNQMFQYALGRRLAIRNRTQLKLDFSGFIASGDLPPRLYGPNIVQITVKFASQNEIFQFTESLVQPRYINGMKMGGYSLIP